MCCVVGKYELELIINRGISIYSFRVNFVLLSSKMLDISDCKMQVENVTYDDGGKKIKRLIKYYVFY